MNAERKKAFISVNLLACKIGGTPIKMVYLGDLITMIENYLVEDVVAKNPDPRIVKIYALLQDLVFSMIFYRSASNPDLNIKITEREAIVLKENIFPVDASMDTEEMHKGVESLVALTRIRAARKIFETAQDEWARATLDPRLTAINFTSSVNKKLIEIMAIIWDIATEYDLIQFTSQDWQKTFEKTQNLQIPATGGK